MQHEISCPIAYRAQYGTFGQNIDVNMRRKYSDVSYVYESVSDRSLSQIIIVFQKYPQNRIQVVKD